MRVRHLWLTAAVAAIWSGSVRADTRAPGSDYLLDVRYRLESVDDNAFAHSALAQTVRVQLGYRWQPTPVWSAVIEGAAVGALDNRYNSTANGKTAYPTVADPQTTQLNRAFVAYRTERFGATLGRQRIELDNQRFIGTSGWRQTDQTFDALALDGRIGEHTTLRYDYLDRVHRVFGDDHPNALLRERNLDAHLFNAAYDGFGGHWVGYGYLIGDQDVPTASTATWGLRQTGSHKCGVLEFGWTLEAAQQSGRGDNPMHGSRAYRFAEGTLVAAGITWRAGWERLGGDGTSALQTPLATLHAFNGWADRFLVTPPGGLQDRYIGASGTFGKPRWNVVWHEFRADHGSAAYGTELDASLGMPLTSQLSGLLKLADYRSDGFSTNERKLWLQLEWKH